jgi:hypothetical protein
MPGPAYPAATGQEVVQLVPPLPPVAVDGGSAFTRHVAVNAEPEADRDTDEETMPKCPLRVSASIHCYPRRRARSVPTRYDIGLSHHSRALKSETARPDSGMP